MLLYVGSEGTSCRVIKLLQGEKRTSYAVEKLSLLLDLITTRFFTGALGGFLLFWFVPNQEILYEVGASISPNFL